MSPARSNDAGSTRYPSRETLDLVRSALSRYLAGRRTDEDICDALDVLAQEARDRRLHAEHVLMAFKTIWAEMPEVRAISDIDERKRLLDHLVKLCVDSFYAR